MDRIRLLAIGTLMAFALTGAAQQAAVTGPAEDQSRSAQIAVTPVEHHLKVLSEKLSLTTDQEDRVRPILQEMHDAWQKAEQDQSLSDNERNVQKHAAFMKADGQIRPILTDDQKKTLDQMEEQMHSGDAGK